MSVRSLKHHEKKLLKKVNFLEWKSDQTLRENQVIQRYGLEDRREYMGYNILVGQTTSIVRSLKNMRSNDPFRIKSTQRLLNRLYSMGLIDRKTSLELADKISVAAFCRRRLATRLVHLKMAPNMSAAIKFIQHGHIRVGPKVITDPAFHVTRDLEDYVTWSLNSKMKKHALRHQGTLDDFDFTE